MTEASPGVRPRPLSPHLQVWRWHVTMLGSILHRGCLMALYVGALILVGWLLALAAGPQVYAIYAGLLGSWLGKLVLLGLTFALFFQLSSTARHMIWDVGKGFGLKFADMMTIASIVFSVVATAAVWLIAASTGAL
jgi:succinate dehydrogenase / fumarate reductase cytochrome b subunit